jgi:lipoprotein-anchoring transpeptidase ErfK/SrfK
MPRTLIIILTAAVALVLAGAGAVTAYDSGRSDVIANGVRIGTVDVGGLTAEQARRRLGDRLLEPLQAPLMITSGGRTFPLSAREARISANLEAMVDAALAASREGGVLARTWRGLTGGTVDARIAPQIAYSRPAVQRIVDKVRVAVGRAPVDAKVEFSADDLSVRRSRSGRTIDARGLRSKVQAALLAPTRARPVTAPVKAVRPAVSEDELADRYPVVVTINRAGFRLTLFKRLERVKSYPIAVGQVGLETPAGLYRIQNKAIDPAWHVPNSDWAGDLAGQVIPGGAPNNPIKARWLGVYDGVGVHGTDARSSIGTNASHGCIRMLIEDVKALYDEVPVGAPIFIG